MHIKKKSWQEETNEWAQKNSLYPSPKNLVESPSFSGIYNDYQCTVRLVPVGLGTTFVFLTVRIEVLYKRDANLIRFQNNDHEIKVFVDFNTLTNPYHNFVRNLLNSIKLSQKALTETGDHLSLFSDKATLTVNEIEVQSDYYQNALDRLVLLTRQIDQVLMYIESSK